MILFQGMRNRFGVHTTAIADVGKSVSRVGGKTQLPAYRAVAGDLRLSYSQFEELESFSRFGTRLDDTTRQALERGQRVREVLKQVQYQPMPVAEQIAVLLAVTAGLLDEWAIAQIPTAENAIVLAVRTQIPDICDRIQRGELLSDTDRTRLLETAKHAIASIQHQNSP
jgi:F-type H+-transporting ATPase subunit alpha